MKEHLIRSTSTTNRKFPNESPITPKVISDSQKIETSLYNYPCGGRALGDCTKTDLLKQIQMGQAEISGWERKVSIYKDIYKLLKKGMTVRQCLKINKLASVFNKYQKTKKAG